MNNQSITIERMRRVWRGKEQYLFPNCDRIELAILFDIAEKKKERDYAAAATARSSFQETSGDLLDWKKVEEVLRVIEQHTVVKDNTVYDKLTNGRLARRYA